MNFVKLYIGDYLRDTGTLTLAQHGAYALMLLEHYATEKPLPMGRELHRLLRADSKSERDAIDFVADKYWQRSDCGLTNARALREIERASHQRAINQEIGKRGGRPKRTESQTESVSEPKANRNHNQTPDTRQNQYPPAASLPVPPADAGHKPSANPPKPEPWMTVEALEADGIGPKIAGQWLSHRRAKKAKLTELAWSGFKAEADKAGWPYEQAVLKAIARNWTGFEAGWVANDRQHGAFTETAYQRSMRERVAEVSPSLARKVPGHQQPSEFFDVEAKRIA
jgi:uncharacterized protein YdaU (DUF1376 family)